MNRTVRHSPREFYIHGNMVDGRTKLSVNLPVKDWLRVQAIVIAHELRIEADKTTPDYGHVLRAIRQARKTLVKAVNRARGIPCKKPRP